MALPLPPPPVNTPFPDDKAQSNISWSWLRWFQQLQAKVGEVFATPGPYADDAHAKAAGVDIGQRYYLPTGAVVVRLT